MVIITASLFLYCWDHHGAEIDPFISGTSWSEDEDDDDEEEENNSIYDGVSKSFRTVRLEREL